MTHVVDLGSIALIVISSRIVHLPY